MNATSATLPSPVAGAASPQPASHKLPRHSMEPPELTLTRTFFPMGFPLRVRTNEAAVFPLLERLWSRFKPLPSASGILLHFDVYVVEGREGADCPPAPVYRLSRPLLTAVADADNFSVVDLGSLLAQATLARATLAFPLYAEWFLLSAPLSCISTRFATPIHSACVSLGGQGVLLCGESGAGKSTLAYACARAGWTFTADDAVLIPNSSDGRQVIGNCHQVRFRPSAAELFPEVAGREITPRAAGKPSIEVPTAELPQLRTAFTAEVRHIVFLDRRQGTTPLLDSFPVAVARRSMRALLFGLEETMAVQYDALDRMLQAPVYRLRYEHLDDAIALLEQLVQGSGR